MEIKIKFSFSEVQTEVEGELFSTSLAQKIADILPYETRVNTWGKEIYFSIPVKSSIQTPQETVERGDIAYWPEGACLCLFFGPTPISAASEIRPASPVEVVGRISSYHALEKVPSGCSVKVEKLV
ncbi:MAG: uncharacterized protein PWP04_1538 [Candidatus Atribacteria bacterium]|nr:uncharacterized protein [Candidatus Atribacteria bacterium]